MSILHEEAASTPARRAALMACHNFSLDQKGEKQLIEQGAGTRWRSKSNQEALLIFVLFV
jgi:hypothetical protein